MINSMKLVGPALISIAVLWTSQASAVTYTWSGGSGDWETVGNWTPVAPTFTGVATGNTSLFNVSVNSPTTTGAAIFADPLTISTGGTLIVSAARQANFCTWPAARCKTAPRPQSLACCLPIP